MALIYRFSTYDGPSDQLIRSRRWGTREGIARVGGIIHEDSGTMTFESSVGTEIAGLTAKDFDPAEALAAKTPQT